MASIHDVSFLHNKMGHSKFRNKLPDFLPEEFMQMRLNFMLEELLEFAGACGFEMFPVNSEDYTFEKTSKITNLEDALDALIDLTYVTLGTADLMGFKNPVPPAAKTQFETSIWFAAWTRVHEANMKKEPVVNAKESSRGFGIDLKKPKGWLKPQFKDLLV